MLPPKSIALQPTTVPGATSRRVRYAPTITEMTSWAWCWDSVRRETV